MNISEQYGIGGSKGNSNLGSIKRNKTYKEK